MILNANQVVIDAFVAQLRRAYNDIYGHWRNDYGEIVTWAAAIAAQIHSNLGDAPYHNLGHTIDVTIVGQEILRGRHITERVHPKEYLHFCIACAFHDIGFVKLLLPSDETRQYPRGVTGAFHNQTHVDRGIAFVKHRFADHEMIDADVVCDFIEQTRFPVPAGPRYEETGTLRGLVRAADFIGQLANLHLYQNQWALFQEFEETGANAHLGYKDADDLRDGYPSFFFNVVKPYIHDGINHLKRTELGRQMVNNLLANVFRAQHPDFQL